MKAPTNLIDSEGKRITLGTPLGRGGEGTVYEVSSYNQDLVAKIYHQPLEPNKQAKLRAMVQVKTRDLLEISTWPTGTIHNEHSRAIVGFLMPKMTGYKEIHMLYGPSHRRSEFKNADWAFLIRAARNTAAAIATCHKMGHVIGDINPNNIVVSQTAIAKLIDCDSFQIQFNQSYYLCEVGVPHFTPPELHGKQFNKVVRTRNHDNFGLALLCFHLLFMGRHPYSGRYRNGIADMPIDRAIREFRFAYSSISASRQMTPPPNTPSLRMLPAEMRGMFELAFEQKGALTLRPTSEQWVLALDRLEKSIVTCPVSVSHKYHQEYGTCPWCILESQSGVQFFVPVLRSIPKNHFDLNRTWADILAISPPESETFPKFTFNLVPLPFNFPISDENLGEAETNYRQENQRRLQVLSAAAKQLQETQKRWAQIGSEPFKNKQNEYKRLYDSHRTITQQFESERKKLETQARQLQLQAYLRNYYIDRIKISGIGPTRAATLASYGVETAADVNRSQIRSIPGFGETLTYELVKWRLGLEQRFVFDSKKTAHLPELVQLQIKYSVQLSPIERALLSGAAELAKLRQDIINAKKTIKPETEKRSRAYQQAKIDAEFLTQKLQEIEQKQARQKKAQAPIPRNLIAFIAVVLLIILVMGQSSGNGQRDTVEPTPQISLTPVTTNTPYSEENIDSNPDTSTDISEVEAVDTIPHESIHGTTNGSIPIYSPGSSSRGYRTIGNGEMVEVIGITQEQDWCKVRTSDGETGWVLCIALTVNGELSQVPIERLESFHEPPPEQPTDEPTPIPTNTATIVPTPSFPEATQVEPTGSSTIDVLIPHALTAFTYFEHTLSLENAQVAIKRIDFWDGYIVLIGQVVTENRSQCFSRNHFKLQAGQQSYDLIPRIRWVRNAYGINSPGNGFNAQCVPRNTNELIVLPFRYDISDDVTSLWYEETSILFNRSLLSLHSSSAAPLPTPTPTPTPTRTPTSTPTNTATPTVTVTPAAAAIPTIEVGVTALASPFSIASDAQRANVNGTVTNHRLEYRLLHIDFWDVLPDGSRPRNDYYAVFLGTLHRVEDGTTGSGCVGASDVNLYVGDTRITMARKLRPANRHYEVNFPGFIVDLCLSLGRSTPVLFVFDVPNKSELAILSFHDAHLILPASLTEHKDLSDK